MWQNFKTVKVPPKTSAPVHERFSVTADVLSVRRCGRLYGMQAEKGFVPSQPTQEFVGTVIHQVLDRAHGHYAGRPGAATKGKIPTDADIDAYFLAVETSLKAHHVRAINKDLRAHTLALVKAFNALEGAQLYPLIHDTEHRLQADRTDYLLYGVVDVLRNTGTGQMEIWDYKGSRAPKATTNDGKKRLRDYKFQMQVYAELYKHRNGSYPAKAIIYFLGELSPGMTTRPPTAFIEVPLDPTEIKTALAEFDTSVANIRGMRTACRWPAPADGADTAGRETCDLCDVRRSCPVEGDYYRRKERSFP